MQEPEIVVDETTNISDEQAAQNLLAEEGIEMQSRTVQESIAKFHFVQQLTAKRTMRNNTRRTKILAGNEKISALISRFKVVPETEDLVTE